MVSIKAGVAAMMVVAGVCGVIVGAEPVSAESNSKSSNNNKCTVKAVGTKNESNVKGGKFTKSNGKITGHFRVTGKNCTTNVSLIVWKLPSGKVRPYGEQKMHKYVWQSFGPGKHALTVDLPNCSYQADLVKGKKETGPNDGPRYFERNIGWDIERGKKCKRKPVVVTKVVRDKEVEVVERKVIVEKEVPAELPETGVASVASGLIGLPALAASTLYYIRSRRFGN